MFLTRLARHREPPTEELEGELIGSVAHDGREETLIEFPDLIDAGSTTDGV